MQTELNVQEAEIRETEQPVLETSDDDDEDEDDDDDEALEQDL
jgi:hypothetical protein